MLCPTKPLRGRRTFTTEIYDKRTGEIISRHYSNYNARCAIRRREKRWDEAQQRWVDNPDWLFFRSRAYTGKK